MAKQLTINAKQREKKTPNKLRSEGFVPATVYGHGFESHSIQINAKEFSKVPYKAYSHINELNIDGEKFPVLIRNVQLDPVLDKFLNIEFYKIKSDEKIKVKVPLNYTGHSPAIVAGGILIVSHNEIEIQCLPKDIPDTIDVNLEEIKEIGQAIHSKDLKVSENIQILAKPEEVLVKVEIPKTHEIEEAAPALAAAEGAAAAPAAEGAAAAGAPGAAAPTGKEAVKTSAKEAAKSTDKPPTKK
ncbi:MAG: hypothetical protein A3I68_08415 [Candidatus Melainabacteria bacterium RIFCSPLOWO2_02_FULL_35_15]|nr:MAG: hypothetical protein A3F80_08640 [Candidatus Melainabacteria bacterium RIFCSPLOWO2_12_FULL_35_11]OGI13994.1 MAG: hypothetical protein A3I68_08415 [Candidatus Melainabacteria bacterium RIFCSPLOWO2_02_FULL_35_15]